MSQQHPRTANERALAVREQERGLARLAGLVYADILAPGIVMRRWQAEQEVGHTTV